MNPYQQRILERVKLFKIPLSIEIPPILDSPKHVPVSLEEVDELKATVARLQKEKEELHQKLCKVTTERNDLKFDINQRGKELDESQRATSNKKGKRKRVKYCLDTMGDELSERNKELWWTVKANNEWKAWRDKASKQRKMMREDFKEKNEHISKYL